MAFGAALQDIAPISDLDATLSCRFCDYIEAGSHVSEDWTAVAETERLVAVPSVGPLVPGWLLVMPKEHVLSFGAVDPSSLPDLMEQVNGIAERWQELFGPLTWFEHGPAEPSSPVGCSVDHAHLHLVPAGGLNLLAGARDMFPRLAFHQVAGPEAAIEAVAEGRPYLYLRSEDGDSWLAVSHDIPSQAFRRVIAYQQGRRNEYNWASFPRLEVLRETLEKARHLNQSA